MSREAASHRFDRRNQQQEDDYGELDVDDSASTRNSDDGSVYAQSIHSRVSGQSQATKQQQQQLTPKQNGQQQGAGSGSGFSAMFTRHNSSSSFQSPSPSSSASASINNGFRSSVKTVTGLPGSALKMLGSMASAVSGGDGGGGEADEYDSKLLGKFDLSVFGDFFGRMEKEDRIRSGEAVVHCLLDSSHPCHASH